MKLDFEQIDSHHQRAKVPGGWLVKAFENVSHSLLDGGMSDGWDWRVAMAFVPDPNYEWDIGAKTSDTERLIALAVDMAEGASDNGYTLHEEALHDFIDRARELFPENEPSCFGIKPQGGYSRMEQGCSDCAFSRQCDNESIKNGANSVAAMM
jgi:hypothetical protein